VKEFVDQEGNLIFEINSKKIIISISKLRILTGAYVLSVFGRVKSLSSRVCNDGEAIRKEEKKGWIYLNLKKIVDPQDENSIIQRKIIETLSHEARHIAQGRSKSKFLKFYRKLDATFFLPLAMMCVLSLIAQIVLWRKEFNVPIYLDILLIFFPVFLGFIHISYLLDPEERDARKFAWKAIKDERWLEIVKVKTIK